MKVDVRIDASQAKALFAGLKNQLPFVAAKTVSALARDVQAGFVKKLPVVFDRPTPFTQKGVYTQAASKVDLTAKVYFPESQDESGKALREYIRPGAELATYSRQQKKTEYLLTRIGFLPPGWVTVPGTYMKAKLDSFGNMPGSYYRQVIRSLQIKTTKGPPKPVSALSRGRAVKMGVATEFFAIAPGGNKLGRNGGRLPAGVYQRAGRGGTVLLQYLKFVKKAGYKQRFDVNAEALAVVNANAQTRFNESLGSLTTDFKPK